MKVVKSLKKKKTKHGKRPVKQLHFLKSVLNKNADVMKRPGNLESAGLMQVCSTN